MQGAGSAKQKQNAFHSQSRKLTQTYAKLKHLNTISETFCDIYKVMNNKPQTLGPR